NQRLVPIEEETTIIRLKGFIGKPEFAKRTRGEQFFFVNKRFVKDAYLNHAILNAYQEVLQDDTFPLYVLFIEIDPAKIDINVHPTKTEIKYEDEKAIYAIIRSAVKRSLGRFHITPSLDFQQESGFSQIIQQKPLEEITPPSINFNPNFNPFDADQPNGRSYSQGQMASRYKEPDSVENNRGSKSGAGAAVPSNWETLYTITQKDTFK